MRAAVTAPIAAAAVSGAENALAELRLRPAAQVHTRGTVPGDDLILTTELTAPEVESGRWKEGGDVQIMVSGAGGEPIATLLARAWSRRSFGGGANPLAKAPGPFNAAVR